MRSLAHGVYPSLLADYGLAKALQTAAEAAPLHATVRAGHVGRYPEAIESAVYFCCLEALQNAAKHATGAGSVALALSETDGARLAFEVRDDGPGLAQPNTGGAGLANMRDRIAAVGGSLAIDSPAGMGTRIAGEVPLRPIELSPEIETLLRRATDALDECFGIFRAVRDQRGGVVDFLVEHLNEAAGRHLGYAREDEIGRTLGQLVPGYLDSEAFRWHRQVLAAGQPMSTEQLSFSGPFADASHLQRAYDVSGAPLGAGRFVLSWRDITERKRTELELRTRSVVRDRGGAGVCLIRASDRVIVYANPRYAQIFGYLPGELNGLPISVLNWEEHPEFAERRVRQITEVLERGGEASFEVHNRCKDGTPIWTEAQMTALEHPDHGRLWAIVQHAVTERKEAPGALRISEERPWTGIEGAPLVLFTFDSDLRCTWFFNNQVGRGGDQSAIGKTDMELFGPEDGRTLAAINRDVLQRGHGVRTELVLELSRRRATFDVEVDPLHAPDGNVDGIAVTAYDVSNRKPAPASNGNGHGHGNGNGSRGVVRPAAAQAAGTGGRLNAQWSKRS
jgi:PAS domain S-box-containing protein